VAGGVISQPLLASLALQSQTYFNMNFDAATLPTPPSGDPGVAGGHFDYDIYYNVCTVSGTSYKCPRNTHVHQYDDKYDVTGVNMLAPSLPAMNVSNAIPVTATKFKVLMANQLYSPAVQFKAGSAGAAWIPVYKYQTPQADTPPLALTSNTSVVASDGSFSGPTERTKWRIPPRFSAKSISIVAAWVAYPRPRYRGKIR